MIHNRRITPARAGKTSGLSWTVTETGDHPRACGENHVEPFLPWVDAGSPPRVRGKRFRDADRLRLEGITPARAGKTRTKGCNSLGRADHPRACGENSFVKFPIKMSLGSPPRVRGKLYLLRDSLDRIGITPARAGKTRSSILNTVSRKDHPRACGENSICKAP